MSWKIAVQKDIIGFNPETASSNKVKRKKELKKAISKVIGKQHPKNPETIERQRFVY